MNKLAELLNKNNINHDVLGFFRFIKGAIEGREYAKFIFTRSLSSVLGIIKGIGLNYNLSKDDLSYLEFLLSKSLFIKSQY